MNGIAMLLAALLVVFAAGMVVTKIVEYFELTRRGKRRPDDASSGMGRDHSISTASIIVGVVLALILKADAIQFISSSEPSETIGWSLVLSDSTRFHRFENEARSKGIENLPQRSPGLGTLEYFENLRIQDSGSADERTFSIVGVCLFLLSLLEMVSIVSMAEACMRNRSCRNRGVLLIGGTLLLSLVFSWLGNGLHFLLPYGNMFVGISITGAGLGFGSMLLHEVLDLTSEIRGLKRGEREQILGDTNTLARRSLRGDIREATKGVIGPPGKHIQSYLHENEKQLRAHANVKGFALGLKSKNGKRTRLRSLVVFVGKKTNDVPSAHFLPRVASWIEPGGMSVEIPIDVVEVGSVRKNGSGIPLTTTPLGQEPGCSIGNLSLPTSGTFGCMVKDSQGNSYVLSCDHVLNAGFDHKEITSPSKQDGGDISTVIADYSMGANDTFVDVAIAKLRQGARVLPNVYGIGIPTSQRYVTSDETEQEKSILVVLAGRSSGYVGGRIIHVCESIDMKDETGRKVTMKNLIMTDKLTTAGDSGALLLDLDCRAIGICVASGPDHSFFIPITTVLNRMKVQLITGQQA